MKLPSESRRLVHSIRSSRKTPEGKSRGTQERDKIMDAELRTGSENWGALTGERREGVVWGLKKEGAQPRLGARKGYGSKLPLPGGSKSKGEGEMPLPAPGLREKMTQKNEKNSRWIPKKKKTQQARDSGTQGRENS